VWTVVLDEIVVAWHELMVVVSFGATIPNTNEKFIKSLEKQ